MASSLSSDGNHLFIFNFRQTTRADHFSKKIYKYLKKEHSYTKVIIKHTNFAQL